MSRATIDEDPDAHRIIDPVGRQCAEAGEVADKIEVLALGNVSWRDGRAVQRNGARVAGISVGDERLPPLAIAERADGLIGERRDQRIGQDCRSGRGEPQRSNASEASLGARPSRSAARRRTSQVG